MSRTPPILFQPLGCTAPRRFLLAGPLSFLLPVFILGVTIFIGCKDQVEQIQAQVQQATKTVQQAAPASFSPGEIQLNCVEKITTKAAHVRLLVLGLKRPNVLQIRSYTDPKTEIYPSVFFQAQTDVSQVSGLVGKTVRGTLFAQTSENGPIYQCPVGELVEVQFSSIDGKELVGSFGSGSLIDSSGNSNPVSGTIRAVGVETGAAAGSQNASAQPNGGIQQ